MKCNEFEKLVNEYVDGELKQSNDIEEHIESCDACRALYEETVELKEMLSDLEMIELPDDFDETLHDKLVEVSKEMNDTKKVSPIRNWNRTFKIAGSIAAVMLLSVLATNTFPMMGSNNDSDSAMDDSFEMSSANVSVMESMDEATEEASIESTESEELTFSEESDMADMDVTNNTMVTTGVPEAASAKALTLRMPTQAFVLEGRTFYLKKTSLESIDRLIEEIDSEGLEIIPNQYQFYIQSSQLEEFVDNLNSQFVVTDELFLDYSYELENFYETYNLQKAYISSLESDYDAAEGVLKDELKVQIEAETGLQASYEIDFNEIERFKNYTQIIIIINEE